MDLTNSTMIHNLVEDDIAQAPINPENLSEDERKLLESQPFSSERALLLQKNLFLHQENLIEKLKEMEKDMESKKQDYWKMEGAKSILGMFIENECQDPQ